MTLSQTQTTRGLTHFVLRWARSITWLLLALSFLIRGLASDLSTLADAVGLMGLGASIAFWTAISQDRAVEGVIGPDGAVRE